MVKLTEGMICSRTKMSTLENVRKLNCWGCELDDITILQRIPNVEVLSLSVNNIDTLQPLAGCLNLKELYLRKNNIKDLRELCHLRRLSKLRVLWLSENPCADDPDYRWHVLHILPSLTTLDNMPVTDQELNAASGADNTSIDVEELETNDVLPPSYHQEEHSFVNESHVNGIGWKTVRMPDRQLNGRRSLATFDRNAVGGDSFSGGMSTSCYAQSAYDENRGGFVGSQNDRRMSSTSMISLHDSAPETNAIAAPREMTTWQQQHQMRTIVRRPSVIAQKDSSNILSAIFSLMNELDKPALETILNETEQRLRRI